MLQVVVGYTYLKSLTTYRVLSEDLEKGKGLATDMCHVLLCSSLAAQFITVDLGSSRYEFSASQVCP